MPLTSPSIIMLPFQHTAARRRLDGIATRVPSISGFNTQPPEGGWCGRRGSLFQAARFNTQPPEGGWPPSRRCWLKAGRVSTHSRPKAAAGSGLLACLGG